jgi:activator of HSP90 ATPase
MFSGKMIDGMRAPEMVHGPSTRRQLISSCAIGLGSLAWLSVAGVPADAQQAMPDENGADKSIFLHQEVDFKAAPPRIYEALLDSKQFSAFSEAPATINRDAGGAFSLFGGHIIGRNIELAANQRIIQA